MSFSSDLLAGVSLLILFPFFLPCYLVSDSHLSLLCPFSSSLSSYHHTIPAAISFLLSVLHFIPIAYVTFLYLTSLIILIFMFSLKIEKKILRLFIINKIVKKIYFMLLCYFFICIYFSFSADRLRWSLVGIFSVYIICIYVFVIGLDSEYICTCFWSLINGAAYRNPKKLVGWTKNFWTEYERRENWWWKSEQDTGLLLIIIIVLLQNNLYIRHEQRENIVTTSIVLQQ